MKQTFASESLLTIAIGRPHYGGLPRRPRSLMPRATVAIVELTSGQGVACTEVNLQRELVARISSRARPEPKVYTFSQHIGALRGRGLAILVLQDVLSRNHTAG
jgi:hypothetical protein